MFLFCCVALHYYLATLIIINIGTILSAEKKVILFSSFINPFEIYILQKLIQGSQL